MSSDADMRQLAREVLAELVPELAAAVPQVPAPPVAAVPAPPVAAVLRPSTWAAPAVPGELVGDGPPGPAAPAPAPDAPDASAPAPPGPDRPASAPLPGEHRTEVVTMHDDEDLDRFVRALIRRLENPRDRLAIRTGRLRFVLDRASASSAVAASPGPELRVERGAVTERVVRRAADERARLVLAPAAVLTPLARELAASLHVKIEKEPRC
jgi:hypothetical protein